MGSSGVSEMDVAELEVALVEGVDVFAFAGPGIDLGDAFHEAVDVCGTGSCFGNIWGEGATHKILDDARGLQELSGSLRADCQRHETHEELRDIIFSTSQKCTSVPKHQRIREKS